jgi:GNAT superfamily N-acetyltransferase
VSAATALAVLAKARRPGATGERDAILAAQVDHMRTEGARRLLASGLTVDVCPPELRSETAFVFEATAKTRWPYKDYNRPVRWTEWVHIYGPRVAEMLSDGRALLATASHEGTRVILGFALWDQFDVLGMLYVKKQFRGAGIGLRLLEGAGVDLPLKVLAETACWGRWVKCHGIPTMRVEESDLAKWKRDRAQVERMSLGRKSVDEGLLAELAGMEVDE